ncbi:hypothetical protein BKA56DRAFT_481391, partial [Ilyonectria sp. MPI-CAGE-AT-0026]
YYLAYKIILTEKNPFLKPFRNCSNNCLVLIKLGISCYYKVYLKLSFTILFIK